MWMQNLQGVLKKQDMRQEFKHLIRRGPFRCWHLRAAQAVKLFDATYGVPQTAPGLLAWIDGAAVGRNGNRSGLVRRRLRAPHQRFGPFPDQA
jgi:hypothetical protein